MISLLPDCESDSIPVTSETRYSNSSIPAKTHSWMKRRRNFLLKRRVLRPKSQRTTRSTWTIEAFQDCGSAQRNTVAVGKDRTPSVAEVYGTARRSVRSEDAKSTGRNKMRRSGGFVAHHAACSIVSLFTRIHTFPK